MSTRCGGCGNTTEHGGAYCWPCQHDIDKRQPPADPMDDLCECGHPHANHHPNDGACKVFVVRKGDSCWCTGFEPKGGRRP